MHKSFKIQGRSNLDKAAKKLKRPKGVIKQVCCPNYIKETNIQIENGYTWTTNNEWDNIIPKEQAFNKQTKTSTLFAVESSVAK